MCEDELICDLAETYGILNYKELSPSLVATLAIGLRDDSRVKKMLSEQRLSYEQMIMAIMADSLRNLVWLQSGAKQSNRPTSIYQKLTEKSAPKDDYEMFETPEEYEEYMKKIKEGATNV